MIREWIRRWLGIPDGGIIVLMRGDVIERVILPKGCDMNLENCNTPGAIITYDAHYGPIRVEHLAALRGGEVNPFHGLTKTDDKLP